MNFNWCKCQIDKSRVIVIVIHFCKKNHDEICTHVNKKRDRIESFHTYDIKDKSGKTLEACYVVYKVFQKKIF